MAINAEGIRQLLMYLAATRGGGSALTNKAIVRGLARGRSPESMVKLEDARGAGFKGRRKGLYSGDDYVGGYVGPDPGAIGEMQELEAIIELIIGAGRR